MAPPRGHDGARTDPAPPGKLRSVAPQAEQRRRQQESGKEHQAVATVHCPEMHVMQARVVREVWNRVLCGQYQARCDACGARISTCDASYHCSACRYSLCVECAAAPARRGGKTPGEAGPQNHCAAVPSACRGGRRRPCRAMAGDIFFCGPDMWGIHHVVLCRGPMRRAEPHVVEALGLGPEMEVFACPTIECSRPLRGQEYPWYPATSFYARERGCTELYVVADLADGTCCLTIFQEPAMVKLLVHPLRPGHGGPPFDAGAFQAAVDSCAKLSQRWGHRTAIKALTTSQGSMDPQDYLDPESRAALMEELRRRWGKKPICSSVAIQVWQMYFEFVCGSGPQGADLATQQILQWMPVRCDQTAPSALLRVLSTRGWLLSGSIAG